MGGGVKFSSEQREHRWDEVLWIRCFSPRIVISSAAGPRVAKERKTKLGRSEIQTAVERAFPTPTQRSPFDDVTTCSCAPKGEAKCSQEIHTPLAGSSSHAHSAVINANVSGNCFGRSSFLCC